MNIMRVIALIVIVALFSPGVRAAEEESPMKIERLPGNPMIDPDSFASIGTNINGPSLIRVPAWVKEPLGRYYLYFAHHKGKHIRLAYADELTGPWHIYEPGALALADSGFPTTIDERAFTRQQQERVAAIRAGGYDPLYTHIASPEAVVLDEEREIRLYYHGMLETGYQATRVAKSKDGLHFTAHPEVITRPYLRVFHWQGYWYGLAMPGVFYRSRDGLTGFEEGPTLFNKGMRHAALAVRDHTLFVIWTRVGDAPERLLLSKVDISDDWNDWRESAPPADVLRPEKKWEGADLPLEASVRGAIEVPVNQLRDPEIFEEDGNTWLLYSVAGESGIAIAGITGL